MEAREFFEDWDKRKLKQGVKRIFAGDRELIVELEDGTVIRKKAKAYKTRIIGYIDEKGNFVRIKDHEVVFIDWTNKTPVIEGYYEYED